jgi:DNA-binding beta-propeller fold protein YncE
MRNLILLLVALALVACGTTSENGVDDTSSPADVASEEVQGPVGPHYLAQLADTMLMGTGDNAEIVKVIPGTNQALLVSSKARKVTLLDFAGGQLTLVREAALFPADASESELTHIAVSPDGSWAVATRTFIETDGDGAQVDCSGELIFLDVADSADFGTLLLKVPVGPMPDAVAISDDGNWVASANERDGPDAWGKCEVAGEEASISILDVSGGPASAIEVHRITLVDSDTGPREPESIVFGADNDLVAATLQDSHELLLVNRSDLTEPALTSEDGAVTIVRLPDDAIGAGPWPDGIGRFEVAGTEYFAIAGEWNDTFTIVDGTGAIIASEAIAPADIPTTLPRVIDEGSPRFSPDSVATFVWSKRAHVAFTLRHSGAVAIYDVSNPVKPVFATAVGVGQNEGGNQDEDGSTIRPEGIAASTNGEYLVVANEGESSVSLVKSVDL